MLQLHYQHQINRTRRVVNNNDMNKVPEWDQPPIIDILQKEGLQTASITDVKGRLPLHIVLSNHDTNHKQLHGIHTFFDNNLGADDGNEDVSEFQQGQHQHINTRFYHIECLRNLDRDLILTTFKTLMVNLGKQHKIFTIDINIVFACVYWSSSFVSFIVFILVLLIVVGTVD